MKHDLPPSLNESKTIPRGDLTLTCPKSLKDMFVNTLVSLKILTQYPNGNCHSFQKTL